MSLVTPAGIHDLADRFADRWRTAIAGWSQRDEVVPYDEAARMLCEAVCSWTGIPLTQQEIARRTDDLVALFDPLAPPGFPYWRARRARERTETWLADLGEATRAAASCVHPRAPHWRSSRPTRIPPGDSCQRRSRPSR